MVMKPYSISAVGLKTKSRQVCGEKYQSQRKQKIVGPKHRRALSEDPDLRSSA